MSGPFQVLQPVWSAQAGATNLVQFQAVALNSSGQAVSPTANGSIVGVMQNNPTSVGQACDIQSYGITKGVFGGSVTVGNAVKIDSSGRFVTASAGDLAAGYAVGVCIINGGGIGQIGSVLLMTMGEGQVAISGSDTVTSGALSINTLTSLTSTTGAQAYTLANGNYVGQRKIIREITAARSPAGTLTIATTFNSEPTVHVFTCIGQEIELEWTASGWHMLRKIRVSAGSGLAVVVGTTVLTGYDLEAVYNLSVTGTVSSTGTKAIPAPTLSGEVCIVRTGTAASTPNGTQNIAGFTKAEVAATALSGINATTCTAQFIGMPDGWHNVNVTTATYS